jgi:hydroxyacylglutathione hydrolase
MTKAKAVIVPVTPFQQNCTLLWCEVTKRAVVIDPGGDLPEVEGAITRARVSADKILLTHGHVDHVQREYIYVPDAAVTAGKRR